MARPNPTDCCDSGVVVGCCPDPISEVLIITYENVSGCSDIDGVTDLLHHVGGGRWSHIYGPSAIACQAYGLKMTITSSVACPSGNGWGMNSACLVNGPYSCNLGNLTWQWKPAESSCSPLFLVFEGSAGFQFNSLCCPGPTTLRCYITQ